MYHIDNHPSLTKHLNANEREKQQTYFAHWSKKTHTHCYLFFFLEWLSMYITSRALHVYIYLSIPRYINLVCSVIRSDTANIKAICVDIYLYMYLFLSIDCFFINQWGEERNYWINQLSWISFSIDRYGHLSSHWFGKKTKSILWCFVLYQQQKKYHCDITDDHLLLLPRRIIQSDWSLFAWRNLFLLDRIIGSREKIWIKPSYCKWS